MSIWELKKSYYLFSVLLGAALWCVVYIYFVIGIFTNPHSKEVKQNKQILLEKQDEIKRLQQLKLVKEAELKQIEELQKRAFDVNEATKFYADIIAAFNRVNIIFELKLERISNHDSYLNLGVVELSFKKKIYYLPDEDVKRLVLSFIKLYLYPVLEFEIATEDNKIRFVAIKDVQSDRN